MKRKMLDLEAERKRLEEEARRQRELDLLRQ